MRELSALVAVPEEEEGAALPTVLPMYGATETTAGGSSSSTGEGQGTPAAAARTDMVAIARASGIASAAWAADEAEFDALVTKALTTDGPHVIGVKIDNEPGRNQTDRDPIRFRETFSRAMAQAV